MGFNGAALNRGRKAVLAPSERGGGIVIASTGPPSIEGGKLVQRDSQGLDRERPASTGPPSIEGGKPLAVASERWG
ncbi:Periplasmic thiol disulfide interchange protein DsbA [Enhygromyxa salina]|uniref:Periplasmic thiol disulfide interchange protein DsbA n=1 Tax=Enhygromyxa salina TaxID=215803 RepID=A0A0C2DBU8_9BACT|nr:Periplasmic thiol disulfide interchange protein DsbA [Enhygromyxa salina]